MKTLKNILEGILDRQNRNAIGEDIELEQIKNKLKDKENFHFDERDTELKKFKIYKSHGKWIVDVNGWITCHPKDGGDVTDGSFKFGRVNRFAASNISSLKYGPKEVVGDVIIYASPNLKDLKDCPNVIVGDFSVLNTGITTLKYFPRIIKGRVNICENEQLMSFKGLKPAVIDGSLTVTKNGIKSNIRDFETWQFDIRNNFNLFDEKYI